MSEPPLREPAADPVGATRAVARLPGAGQVDVGSYPVADFGPLRVPVPPDAQVRMSVDGAEFADAVFFDLPSGSIRLSVLAAPRTGGLWPERAEEIAGIQAGIGARVSSVRGQWGRELHIVHNGEYNWVIGVDGPRSMLLGRATWTDDAGRGLVDTMREMIGRSRVERGDDPMPVRAPLPLRRPGSPARRDDPEGASGYAATVMLRTPPPPEPGGTPASSEPPAVPGAPTPISVRRGVLVAAAAVLVIAGGLWITREEPVPVRAAGPATAGVALPPGTAERPPPRPPAGAPGAGSPFRSAPAGGTPPGRPTRTAPESASPADGGGRRIPRSRSTGSATTDPGRGAISTPDRSDARSRRDSTYRKDSAGGRDSTDRKDSAGGRDSTDRKDSAGGRDSIDRGESTDQRDPMESATEPGRVRIDPLQGPFGRLAEFGDQMYPSEPGAGLLGLAAGP